MSHVDDDRLTALEELYRARYLDFLRVATAIVGSDRAHDAVQDAFVRAVRARQQQRDEGALEPWVWSILVNTARSLRVRRSDIPTTPAALTNGQVDDPSAIRAAIAALPERQRHVVYLRYYADLDYGAISEALGIRVGTVSATLSQAHAALKAKLEGSEP